ncbi:GTP-binding protein [Streptomyces sp. NPDC049555]|uniref:GTP-binding protein n=1 Tax=Streptomyces sp. NPDC049555 TaxID=3154930 RepID=UPI003441FCFE
MPEPAYARTKPHLTIATLGHRGHGKTTLTAALAHLLGAPAPFGAPYVEYETGTRHYAHADLPGRPRRLPALIAGLWGLDGALLVVSAHDGVTPSTAEHLLLARTAGVHHVVVAMTRAASAGPTRSARAEAGVRELLAAHGGGHVPVVRVDARAALAGDPRWRAALEALVDAVDTYVPTPVRYADAPFLLPLSHVRHLPGGATAVTGTVERGTLRPGERVELPGAGASATAAELRTFGRLMDGAEPGDRLTLLLTGPGARAALRGDVVTAPGGITPLRRFRAHVALSAGVRAGQALRFHLRTAEAVGTLVQPPGAATSTVELDRAVALTRGLPFAVRRDGRTVGTGVVTGPLPAGGQ